MEAKKFFAIFIPIFAIMVFTIINTFLLKKEATKRQKQITTAVAISGFSVLIVVGLVVL